MAFYVDGSFRNKNARRPHIRGDFFVFWVAVFLLSTLLTRTRTMTLPHFFQSLRAKYRLSSNRASRKRNGVSFRPAGPNVEALETRTLLSAVAGCDYFEDFEDAGAGDFNPTNPAFWSVVPDGSGFSYQINGTSTSGLQTSILDNPGELQGNYEVSVDMTGFPGKNQWHDGFIVFDYVSDSDFKYAGFFGGQNQWVIGHWEGNFSNRMAQVDWDDESRDIVHGQTYNVNLEVQGNKVFLRVDDELVVEGQFAGGEQLHKGDLGLATFQARTQFDNFCVDNFNYVDADDFPAYKEDFDDLVAEDFIPSNPGLFSTVEKLVDGGSAFVYQVGDGTLSGLQTSVVDLGDVELPENYKVSADIEVVSVPLLWSDGFIVFDYHSPTDFKYAGTFAGYDRWVVGHFDGNFSDQRLVVDWRDEGRTIDNDTVYGLEVVIKGGMVTLIVDGEEIGTADFSGSDPLNDGKAGVANKNGVTHFDNFCIEQVDLFEIV